MPGDSSCSFSLLFTADRGSTSVGASGADIVVDLTPLAAAAVPLMDAELPRELDRVAETFTTGMCVSGTKRVTGLPAMLPKEVASTLYSLASDFGATGCVAAAAAPAALPDAATTATGFEGLWGTAPAAPVSSTVLTLCARLAIECTDISLPASDARLTCTAALQDL